MKPSKASNLPPEPLSPTALRSRALAMLTRREHSQAELRQKLIELGGEDAVVAAILAELGEQHWQDDRRFAEMMVRTCVRKGQGELTARQELRQRGIDAELASAALMDQDWFDLARTVRSRKFGDTLPTDRKEQARQLRFLQYRGFSSEQCWHALKNSE